MRKFLDRLLMLHPGYRKAHFVGLEVQELRRELVGLIEGNEARVKAAIAAARPADRTDELKAAIAAARPADRTDELKAAIAAAKPVDRTDELKAAIAAARPADRTDELKAAIKANIGEFGTAIDQINERKKNDLAAFTEERRRVSEAALISQMQRMNIIGGDRFNALMHEIGKATARTPEGRSPDAVKEALRTKWALVDRLFKEPAAVACPVCGKTFDSANAEKCESDCIWGGGRLVRYVCPECGLTFGPMKMFELTEQEFSDDYKTHYSVYSEGDCTEQEKRVFRKLDPKPGAKYLNWGCGAWSRTIEELRAEGFDVYGYEPYAKTDAQHVFTSLDAMKGMKFDGIFSHDLLEHVRDPLAFFRENAGLLSPDGVMVHSTACFERVYEYTRFHLFFYTGGSLEEICRRTGLQVLYRDVDDVCLQIDVGFKRTGPER